jgi:hypothetical protein
VATETEEEIAFEERADYIEDKQLELWNIEVDWLFRTSILTGIGATFRSTLHESYSL